jgi:hypothetical protein
MTRWDAVLQIFRPIGTMSTLEVCVLCGHILFPGVGRRYKKYDTMTDLISSKCIPTAFVYACVTQYTGNTERHTVCIACVNWTRSVLSRALPSTNCSFPDTRVSDMFL